MKPVCVAAVLLSCISVSYTCPGTCRCYDKTVECQNKNFAAIPSGIPVTTEKL